MAKVKEIFEWMDDRYPFALAENYDNCGLLIGDTERVVSRCMLALDVTGEVLADAICWQVDLIITHHPVIFNALKRLSVGDIPYECIRHGIAVLSSHTCLDRAIGGVNDALSECLSLQNVTILDETDGFLRTGILPKVMEPVEFAAYCKKHFLPAVSEPCWESDRSAKLGFAPVREDLLSEKQSRLDVTLISREK